MSRIVVIGGSDAGVMAALRMDPSTEVTMMLADLYPNFSICGLPFYVSGEVDDWRALAHRTTEEIARQGVEVLVEHVATKLDPSSKAILTRANGGRERVLRYDVAIIATGARPRATDIQGMDLPGVHPLHTMMDSFRVRSQLDAGGIERAIIVGAGYIGLEMADALVHRGVEVTLVGRTATVMPSVDASLGALVQSELARHGVEVAMGIDVGEIGPHGRALEVRGTGGFSREADLVLVAGGVEPNAELAQAAGVETGIRGAIKVDRRMRTNVADVLAAGDCVETWHRTLQRATYLPLGTTAHKQGRVAGETAAGGDREFQGSLGTQVVKVFDVAVARTGLGDDAARAEGLDPLTVASTPWHHKVYYPGAHPLHIRVTADRRTRKLLGAQIVGHWQAEVAKRIDVFAVALFHAMTVDGMSDLDLSYTPPLGAPWDAVQEAAHAWITAAR